MANVSFPGRMWCRQTRPPNILSPLPEMPAFSAYPKSRLPASFAATQRTSASATPGEEYAFEHMSVECVSYPPFAFPIHSLCPPRPYLTCLVQITSEPPSFVTICFYLMPTSVLFIPSTYHTDIFFCRQWRTVRESILFSLLPLPEMVSMHFYSCPFRVLIGNMRRFFDYVITYIICQLHSSLAIELYHGRLPHALTGGQPRGPGSSSSDLGPQLQLLAQVFIMHYPLQSLMFLPPVFKQPKPTSKQAKIVLQR